MTALYTPRPPYTPRGDALQDANGVTLCVMEEELYIGEAPQSPTHHLDGERLAARIADALNALDGPPPYIRERAARDIAQIKGAISKGGGRHG